MSDQPPSQEIQKGVMPIPRYFSVELAESLGVKRMIGIEGYSPDGDVKTFIFFRNLGADIETPEGKSKAAAALTGLKLGNDADAAIGPAISLSKSNAETGQVANHPDRKAIGIYVEKEKRLLAGNPTSQVSELSPGYSAYFQKALQAIPKPPTTPNVPPTPR